MGDDEQRDTTAAVTVADFETWIYDNFVTQTVSVRTYVGYTTLAIRN